MIQKGKIPGLGAGNTVFTPSFRQNTPFFAFLRKFPHLSLFKIVLTSLRFCFFLKEPRAAVLSNCPVCFLRFFFFFNFLLRVGVISYRRRLLKRKTPHLEWLNRQVHRKRAGSALPPPGAERQKESFPVAPAPPRIR